MVFGVRFPEASASGWFLRLDSYLGVRRLDVARCVCCPVLGLFPLGPANARSLPLRIGRCQIVVPAVSSEWCVSTRVYGLCREDAGAGRWVRRRWLRGGICRGAVSKIGRV